MTEVPNLYHVTLTVDAEGKGVADALTSAFRDGGPFLAAPSTIGAGDGYVTVRFAGVSDDPTTGPKSVEHSTPGAEVVGALAGFSHHHSLAVALVKALLTFAAMREAAGLPPRHELRIDVVPAQPLPEDTLSLQLSEGVSGQFPEFGTRQDAD